MSVRLKIATTPKEIDDVFWLRHEVYVKEDGKFGGKPLPHERISDRYDAFPNTCNIIAYEGDEPVGTLRANLESSVGLPSEELFDFSAYIKSLEGDNVVVASGGMFAIREKWRGKRNVIYAMLKMITGIYNSWGVTHVIATSNHETVSVYEHLGFESLNEPIWIEHIGNHIVPMATPFERMYRWAFGALLDSKLDSFWVDNFSEHFERVLLSKDDVLFCEGDAPPFAYIIDDGWIGISRKDPNGDELTLATLGRGDIVGELALLDKKPRSATATAVTNVELIQIDRDTLFNSIRQHPAQLEQLLNLFAQRIRRTDDLAMVMAFAPQTGRVKFALESLRNVAIANSREPALRVVKMGPTDLAKSAGVREHEVMRVLEMEKLAGNLDYGKKIIKFIN
jgi:CRP-like cAMP-binding protein